MKRVYSIENGKKGGRPSFENNNNQRKVFEMPELNIIFLTENQYETLIERYGYKLISNALRILQSWLKSSPIGGKHRGKNNYAQFRSDGWLIYEAKQMLNKSKQQI